MFPSLRLGYKFMIRLDFHFFWHIPWYFGLEVKPPKEVLEMLLEHLPRWYPEHFQVTPVPSHCGQPFGPDTVVALKVAWGEKTVVKI